MTAADMLPLLQAWHDAGRELHARVDQLSGIAGHVSDSPLGNAIWTVWNAYSEQLAHRIGDTGDWLAWWEDQTHMGAKPGEVHIRCRGRSVRIQVDSLARLAAIIVETRA